MRYFREVSLILFSIATAGMISRLGVYIFSKGGASQETMSIVHVLAILLIILLSLPIYIWLRKA